MRSWKRRAWRALGLGLRLLRFLPGAAHGALPGQPGRAGSAASPSSRRKQSTPGVVPLLLCAPSSQRNGSSWSCAGGQPGAGRAVVVLRSLRCCPSDAGFLPLAWFLKVSGSSTSALRLGSCSTAKTRGERAARKDM